MKSGQSVLHPARGMSQKNVIDLNVELGLSEGSVYSFCRRFAQISEKSITVGGRQNYIRNFSAGDTVVYHAMESKSVAALRKLDFLKRYAGILLHNHETALYHFGTDHAECNVHIIRYLRKNTEETGNQWSDEMISLLCAMNEYRKKLVSEGISALVAEEKALLNRMEKYSHNHLLFLHDFHVPFDDKIFERNLRKAKTDRKRQAVSVKAADMKCIVPS